MRAAPNAIALFHREPGRRPRLCRSCQAPDTKARHSRAGVKDETEAHGRKQAAGPCGRPAVRRQRTRRLGAVA